MSQEVLLIGSGISVAPLCDYLTKHDYKITVASRNESTGNKLAENEPKINFVLLRLPEDNDKLELLIKKSTMVASFVLGKYQPQILEYCIQHQTSLIISSHAGYLFKDQDEFSKLDQRIKEAGIAVVTEASCDPGVGSMIGKRIIDRVQNQGGKITDIWYHVGVLPLKPHINPFGYKCFWAAKKAMKASVHIKDSSADWIRDSQRVVIKGDEVYLGTHIVEVPGIGTFESRPNSDSCAWLYPEIYGVSDVVNFYQGTLRFLGWGETLQSLINLGFADLTPLENSKLQTYRDLVLHLCEVNTGEPKALVAKKLGIPLHSDTIRRLEWLGLFENKTFEGNGSSCDVITDLLVEKLGEFASGDQETDQVIMYYSVVAEYPDRKEQIVSITHNWVKANSKRSLCSKLTSQTAAMIAKRLMEGSLKLTGLQYPTIPEIYQPILDEYEQEGIYPVETVYTEQL